MAQARTSRVRRRPRARCRASGSSRSSIPARSASIRTASGKVAFSFAITKLNTLPPRPQPKHLKICLLGLTVKEGVFSLWKGHSAT